MRSKKSIPDVFAYLLALATTSLRLAVRKASFASAPFFLSLFSLISPFLSLNCFFSSDDDGTIDGLTTIDISSTE